MNGILLFLTIIFLLVGIIGTVLFYSNKKFLKEIENDPLVGEKQKTEYRDRIIPKNRITMIVGWVLFCVFFVLTIVVN